MVIIVIEFANVSCSVRMNRKPIVVILLVLTVAVVGLIPLGISRNSLTQAKVDVIPTGPSLTPAASNLTSPETAEMKSSNSTYVAVSNKTGISKLQYATLLSAPLDPRAGKASINETAIGTATDLFEATANDLHFVNGTSEHALQFHAYYEDYFSYDNSSSLASPSFTVSFWIMRDPNDQNYGHFVSYFNDTSHAGWYFDVGNSTDQSIRFTVTNSNGSLFQTGDVTLQVGRWNKVVGVFDGSNVAIYRNGSLASSVKFAGTYNSSPRVPLRLAESSYCNSCVPTGLSIDELQIYRAAATASEISARWNSSQPLVDSISLAGYWKFDNDLRNSIDDSNGTIATLIAGMASAPDGRIFFTEKNTGDIRVLQNDRVLQAPFATIRDVFPTIMYGLLGIAVDPEFETNHFLYTYYTTLDNQTGQAFNRLVRFTDVNGYGTNETVLFDRIPAFNGMHTGGALGFGPDGKLYLTVGDGYLGAPAQNTSSLLGKTLRINKDGSIPSDNPFPNSAVYSYGHRNDYGIAFDNKTGVGISTENGENTYDQINLVIKGANYGWPNLRPQDTNPELSNSSIVKPIMVYMYEIAPTQAVFYDNNLYPALNGTFLYGSYNRGEIYGLKLDSDAKHVQEAIEIKIPQNVLTDPVTAIAISPTGEIYFAGHHIYKLTGLTLLPATP